MTKHADKRPEVSEGALRVLDEVEETTARERILPTYDATVFVGLQTTVYGAAIEHIEGGEVTIELPKLPELLASAAVARCLMPERLRGSEDQGDTPDYGDDAGRIGQENGRADGSQTVSR